MNDIRESDAPATPTATFPDTLPVGRVLRAYALSTDVERLIDACLTELRLTIPLLRPWRGLRSGSRVLGAHIQPGHGEALPRGVTRVDVEFLVDVEFADADAGGGPAAHLTCRSTIRGRDHETTHARFTLDEHGKAQLGTWVENALLVFAARWFEARHARPRT